MPVRIYDISKKLGLENKQVLSKARELGISARVASSALDKITAEYLEEQLCQAHPNLHALTPAPAAVPVAAEPRTGKSRADDSKPDETLASVRRLVIPLRNRETNFFEVSPWFLSDDIRVQEISDEDYATLHREEKIFVPIVTPKSQCLVVDLQEDADYTAYEAAAKVQFVFKTFSQIPLILSHAAVIAAARGQRAIVEKTLALPVWGDYGQFLSSPFLFADEASAQKITQFFKVLTIAIQKHPGLLITLSRFNSCWLRSTDHDRVIDVAISLESLLSSQTEIKFKFALFNSFIVGSLPEEREKAFELLQLLYDARSSIVHGDSKSQSNKRKIDKVLASMEEVFRMAQSAISYYIFFLYCRDPNDWQMHIEKLVFGTEMRLNQEETKNENQVGEKA